MVCTLTSRFEEALVYAVRLHADQYRKVSGAPYISHLLGVAALVLEYGGNEDEAIAALLHDAIEDQGGAVVREEIGRRFGDRVVEIVNGCTDADTQPKPPWRRRKETYIAHLGHAGPSVRLVSAADKLYNVRTILSDYRRRGETVWDRFKGGKKGTLWYYRAVVDSLTTHADSPLVVELSRVVTELERLAG